MNPGINVLIIEDDEGMGQLIKRILQKEGITAHVCLKGSAGIEYLRKHPSCSLLLLDYKLSDMTGKEFIEKMNALKLNIPFVVMTGYGDERIAVDMMNLGASDYIIKGDEFLDLIAVTVKNIVDRQTALKKADENSAIFRGLIDASNDAIYVVDVLTGNFLDFSESACRTTGYDRQKLFSMKVSDLDPTMAGDSAWKDHARDVKKRGSLLLEGKHIREDGTTFPVEVNVKYMVVGERDYIVAVARDITERKQMLAAWQREVDFSRSLSKAAQIIILILDVEGKIISINPFMEELSGYTNEESIGRDWLTTFLPECDHDKIRNVFKDSLARENVPGSVNPIICKDGSQKMIEWHDAVLKDEEEKTIGLIALGTDVTQAIEKEKKIERSLEGEKEAKVLLDRIINLIPVRIFWKDKDLKFLGCNKVFAQDAGLDSPQGIVGKDDYEMSWKEQADLYRKDDEEVMKSKNEKLNIEEPQTTPGGNEKWLSTNKVPMLGPDGKVTGVLGAYMDITERKQAEQRFMDVFHASGDAILLIDGDTFVDANEATARLLGYENSQDFLMTHPSKLSPEQQPDGRLSFEKANQMMEIAQEKGFNRFEWMHKKRSGEVFLVEVSLTPITYKGKNILHCLWRDLTEKNIMEEDLKKKEFLLEEVGHIARIGGWELDVESKEVLWTKEVYRIHELDGSQQVYLSKATEFFDMPDRIILEQAIKRGIEHGEEYDLELPFTTASGRHLWTRAQGFPVKKGEQIVKLRGIFQDITEQKENIAMIENMNKILSEVQDSARIGYWTYNVQARMPTWSKMMFKIFGCDPKGGTPDYNSHRKFIHPDSWELFDSSVQACINEQRSYDIKLKILFPDQSIHYCRAQGSPRTDQSGNVNEIYGYTQDITEIYGISQKLLEQEERLRFAAEGAGLGIFDWDIVSDKASFSERWCAMLGYSPDEIKPESASWSSLIHPDDKGGVLKALDAHFEDQSQPYQQEFRMKCKDGNWKWVLAAGEAVERASDNKPVRMIGIHQDINDRKEAEKKLKKTLTELQEFQELTIDREVAMVELKKEINALYMEQGKNPPYEVGSEG